MKVILFISMVIFGSYQLFSQEEQKDKKVFIIWVKLNNGETIKGYLSQRKDSSITVLYLEGTKSEDFKIAEIERLKFRRKGRVGRGIGYGAAGGLLVGAVAGLTTGENSFFGSREGAAAAYGLGLIPIGAITGGVIGSIKKAYTISGNQKNYEIVKNEFLKYEK